MTAKGRNLILAAAAAALLAVMATGAAAQGAFYREVVKDGRIFVFNNMEQSKAWDQSGEMGVAITRLGFGPNGETVVFDSEEAINLYNFKHDRPGEVFAKPKPPKPPVMTVAWKDGKTTITTDKAALSLSNRVQARFTEQLPDDTVKIAGTGAAGDPMGSFRIRRAKTKFEGWFYKKTLTYEVQLNWPDTANPLEDANLNWEVSNDKSVQVKIGQFKVPFGRQELTSSGSQQFVDRSIVSSEFAKGRDAGVQLWGLLMNQKLDWRLGVFNGNGRTKTANDNDKYQFNGRLTFQPWGDVKYSESDFESTDKPLLALAADFEINDLANTTADQSKNLKRTILGGDVSLKYRGLSVFAEYFDRNFDVQGPAKAGDPTPSGYKSSGYHGQIGYLFAKKTWELALRYAAWDPTDAKSDDDRTEIGGAVSYFYNKHNLKVQADFRQLEDKAKGTKDQELRVQTQLIF